MTAPKRFLDTGDRLISFAMDEVQVLCPRCKSPGIVQASFDRYRTPSWHNRFSCTQCCLALSSEAHHWLGPIRLQGRRPCGFCGHQWLMPCLHYASPPASLPEHLTATCPACKRQTEVSVAMSRELPQDRCIDPHFGLPLRLTTPTRHGTVWAYNRRHLAALDAFVNADLRETQGSNYSNHTLFSVLPKWMKLAKHRSEIAKALLKLRTMC